MIGWILVTGIIFAFISKMGFWGFILGCFIGGTAYRAFRQYLMSTISSDDKQLYMIVTFEVLGHISKSKGIVTEADISVATRIMEQFQLNTAARKAAQEAFNRGKLAGYPLRNRVRALYQSYRHRKTLLKIFLEFQIHLAINDGIVSDGEKRILFIIAEEFRMSKQSLEHFLNMLLSGQQFKYSQQYQSQSSSYSPRPSLKDAYKVLGLEETQDSTVIKRAYRKLMNEHHPDKLISKGLPPEMIDIAKQRTQEIQAAYDLIKKHLGFK